MKKYLVACDLGGGVIQPYTVEVEDNYIPASDNMLKFKEIIVKDFKPHVFYRTANVRPGCDGRVSTDEDFHRSWGVNDLQIISISRLDI